eukprot:TRINITY_DN5764_c0_g1_i1.p2 TRINITY_DN5764_c0_g1~~TRINITY_DN5764_c0_g1_i1.p2  ORF type:complete len:172 (-),score=70.32 TRINITY_DN5764_c0_g1_i1:84-599(-)
MAGIIFYHPRLGEKRSKIMEEAFRRADRDGNGRITVEEIMTVFKENGVSCSKEEIETIFISADKDGSGQLNIKEFIASSKAVNMVKEAENCAAPKSPGLKRKGAQPPPPPDKAQMAFKLYDKDKDGYITRAEMVKLSKTLTKEQVEKAFSKFDSDGDGKLSYAEFRKMMNK